MTGSLILLVLTFFCCSYLILTNQTTYELVRRRRIPYLRFMNSFYALLFYIVHIKLFVSSKGLGNNELSESSWCIIPSTWLLVEDIKIGGK